MEKCKQNTPNIFLFLLLIFNSAQGRPQFSFGTKFDLIHRHDIQYGVQTNQIERLRQLLHSDTARNGAILQNIRRNIDAVKRRQVQEHAAYFPARTNSNKIKDRNVSGEMSMRSGADSGTGQYFVQFKVGSPAQKVLLIADTGSDLTWMNCKYRCSTGEKCGKKRTLNNRRVFRADRSLSFKSVPCNSSMCKVELANLFSLARCDFPTDPCAYDYRYSDGSSARGLFANETVTFSLTNGRKTRLHNVLVGCSETVIGQSFSAADGIIGLGYSNHSFALKAANKFGGKFSYCLVDHLSPKNTSSYLIFGPHEKASLRLETMQYTKLVLGVIAPFYAVNIDGISINNSMVEIPSEVWDVNSVGGVILDSGSSLTFLTQPAYDPVMDAMKLALVGFKNVDLGIGQLEYCFNSTGFNEDLMPRFQFQFSDGAIFEPPVKSYVIDAAVGVKCLGFVAAAWPGVSVIGNIMQQNHLWEYDIANGRLGFATSTCN